MPTALIVEDEPEANKLLSLLVQLRGYQTQAAFTGREALDRVDAHCPDVILLDLMLPDISGYDVCRALKNRKETALVPVVMVTARVAVENRIQSFVLGADGYVPKPYTPDQIYEALDDAERWRRGDDGQGPRGAIVLASRDEGETLRRLARMRNLLLARTPLDPETVGRLADSLIGVYASADSWGQRQGVSRVATLTVQTGSHDVTFTFSELPGAGWLRSDPRPPADRWPEAFTHDPFDFVSTDPGTGSVTFVRQFQREAPAGSPGFL